MTSTDADRLQQARQALLRQRLRGAPRAGGVSPVTRRRDTAPAPLSLCQRQLWYLSQLAPDSAAYNELVTIRKTGPLDADALRRAFTEIVRRHEMWRTTFSVIDGEPRQVVHAPPSFELPVLDLTDRNFAEAELAAGELAAGDTRRPYDLAKGPLLRPRLVRLATENYRLYLGLHHLVFDGVSLYRVVLPELAALYNAYAAGLPNPLPEPPIQYSDYALWEHEAARRPEVAARVERWRDRLASTSPLELPLDHPRPLRQRFRGGMVALHIQPSTVGSLRAIGVRQGASFFQVLAAAYAWWLHAYTGQEEVIFATLSDLRRRDETSTMVGYCLTPVVLRGDVSGQPTLAELISRMRDEVVDALDDVVPFAQLVRALGVARDPRSNPLFQTSLVLEPPMLSPDPAWSVHQMETGIGDAVGSSKLALSVELDERPGGHLAGRLIYDADLFQRGTAELMAQHWSRLLDVIATDPEGPLSALEVVDDEDRRRQLEEWSPPPDVDTVGRCVHDLIRIQAERTPEAVAVVSGDDRLTYAELETRAMALAQRLVAAGACPGSVVATLLDRGVDLIVGLLGVLKSGAAYLPLEPGQPASRASFMIDDTGAELVLTHSELMHLVPETAATALTIDHADQVGDAEPIGDPPTASPDDPAYVIFTSGSTGVPKGVLVEHHSLAHIVSVLFQRLGVQESDTMLAVVSYTFDISVGDIFGTLAAGATLVIASKEQTLDPQALGDLIARSKATFMHATPTTWSALIGAGWPGSSRLAGVSVGEPLSVPLADKLAHRCASVWNAYGPTEATHTATCGRVLPGEPMTVGRPLDRVRVYILDPHDRLVPGGVPGEIVIAGPGVARGYVNRPEQTAARFADDPFVAGERVYRTGDRGRFLLDGRLEHLGRFDAQIKVRGFRIEPGEIEATLDRHPDVSDSVVTAVGDHDGDRHLVAYVVGGPAQDTALRAWVRSQLPDYMVPGVIVHLSTLPVTASGKVDRSALPTPQSTPDAGEPVQRPRHGTERRLTQVWSNLLGTEVADVTADFFDLGGHSLLAARLIRDIAAEFGQDVRLVDFIEHGTTIAGLAALLDAGPATDAGAAPSADPLFLVYPDHVSAVSLRHFARSRGAAQLVHPLVPAQPGGRFVPGSTVEGLVPALLQEIRRTQPHGPYALAGFSLGGLLAYEIARQLSAAGERIEWLSLLDTPSPTTADFQLRGLSPWGRLKRLREQSRHHQWAKVREVALRSIRHGPNAPSPDEHFDMRGAVQIAHRYAQPGHEVATELFATADTVQAIGEAALGWGGYHRGPLTVTALPGDHDTLLDQPQVDDVAQLLLGSLQRSRAARATPSAENQRTAHRR